MTARPGLAPLELSVAAADGLILQGTLRYPEGAPPAGGHPLAVLAHQYPATRDSFAPLVSDLLGFGVATLAFDQRGHGASIRAPGGPRLIDAPADFDAGAFGTAFGASIANVEFHRMEDDVVRVAALGCAQNFIDPSRLALIGASVGGSAVLLAAPRVRGLRAVATLGAAGAPAFGPDAPDRIRRALQSGPPAYLASSERDPFDGGMNVRRWSEGIPRATARIVPGADHAMAIYYAVRDEAVAFLRRALVG